jgi:hypothetical protein
VDRQYGLAIPSMVIAGQANIKQQRHFCRETGEGRPG